MPFKEQNKKVVSGFSCQQEEIEDGETQNFGGLLYSGLSFPSKRIFYRTPYLRFTTIL
jgi:hypothetical protein